MRGHLILGQARLEELQALPVRGVADGADHAHALLLIDVLDGARLHHRGHAIDPVDTLVLEHLDHVDVDEVDAQLHSGNIALLHLLLDAFGELGHLHDRGGAGSALDPGEGVLDVLFWNPGIVPFELEADVALFEYHRRIVTAEQGVAQAGLELAPAGGEGGRDIADVFVVHQQHRAQAVGLHPLPGPFEPIGAHPVPVDALLPIHSHRPKVCHQTILLERNSVRFSIGVVLLWNDNDRANN